MVNKKENYRCHVLTFLLILIIHGLDSLPCVPKSYGFSSSVCVCNSSYCDSLDSVAVPAKQYAVVYTSSRSGERFAKSTLKFNEAKANGPDIFTVNRTNFYQFVLGFGGAFTDAAGINIASLPANMQTMLISSYFSKNGLEYTMGRVPMASCDFSTSPYSYDDTPGDFNLTHFQLAKEDFQYKIPYIKLANSTINGGLLLFGSPWSAPAWMKSNGKMYGQGSLKGQPGDKYYQTWAEYFVRFLQEYEKQNISFWGLTAQNEPIDGFTPHFAFQAMAFTPEMQRDFIKLNLGPTLKKAGYGTDNIKLMIMDDSRLLLPRWTNIVLNDLETSQYVSGLAFHWYANKVAPPRLLDFVQAKHPDIFLLSTEACAGSFPWDFPKAKLGSWERAEDYAHDIIQDLLHWSVGWIDWNLALDTNGGPNWVKNYVDAPIIVNATGKEFYKQPMYYALAHFSKLLPPGSFRIGLDMTSNSESQNVQSLDIAAFQTPVDAIVVIIVNRQDTKVSLTLQDLPLGYVNVTIPEHSFQSLIWHV